MRIRPTDPSIPSMAAFRYVMFGLNVLAPTLLVAHERNSMIQRASVSMSKGCMIACTKIFSSYPTSLILCLAKFYLTSV